MLPAFMRCWREYFMGGLVMYDYISLAEAARAGARYAATAPQDDTGIQNAVKAAAPTYAPNSLNIQTTPVATQQDDGQSGDGDGDLRRDFSSDPLQKNNSLFGSIPLSWDITGIAVMRVE